MDSEEYFEIEPNRVAEYYRNFHPLPTSAKVEKHLDFIDVCEDGNTILGSSDLTGRYWKGSVFHFAKPGDIIDRNSVSGINFNSGVIVGKYLDGESQFVVGEDSGTLNVLSMTRPVQEKAPRHMILQCKASEHDDMITSLDVFQDKIRVVTGSLDCCIKIWDCNAMVAESTYRPAHSQGVLSVSAHASGYTFASGSRDHLALMWDQRQEKPAQLVLRCNVAVTAVAWQPGSDFLLAVGDESGSISLVDTRENRNVLGSSKPFQHSIFKLRFSPYSSNMLAACADDNKLVTLDCDRSKPLTQTYEDTRHNDFIRGISWTSAGELFSCSWDSQVLSHQPMKDTDQQ